MKWITDRMPDVDSCIGAVIVDNGRVVVGEIRYDTNLVEDSRKVAVNEAN